MKTDTPNNIDVVLPETIEKALNEYSKTHWEVASQSLKSTGDSFDSADARRKLKRAIAAEIEKSANGKSNA